MSQSYTNYVTLIYKQLDYLRGPTYGDAPSVKPSNRLTDFVRRIQRTCSAVLQRINGCFPQSP